MTAKEARNRKYLTNLFNGPFPGHALIYDPPPEPRGELGDFTLSDKPVREWVGWYARDYQNRVRAMEALDDDGVPYVNLNTNTGVFAAAFGCPLHAYEGHETNAIARPIVQTAEEAARLPEASLDAPTLSRFFALADLMTRELGPDVPVSVPDIQSPFDIAAQIWDKEALFLALVETPEAVRRLVDKCHRLLNNFLVEFKRRYPSGNLCHCPYAWAPPELGCWLSEDEAGSISLQMFEEFCLPSLVNISQTFGGMFMHCCATADHQYSAFAKIPHLRGLNRGFQKPGPKPCLDLFSGQAVLMMGWTPEAMLNKMLDLALPNTRYLFNINNVDLDGARALYDRLRVRMPRVA